MVDEVYKADVVVDVIDRTEPALGRIRTKVSAFERSMGKVQARLQTWSRGLTSVGRSMTRNITLPIIAIGAASLKMYADFQKSFTNIRALVGIGGKALDRLREQTLTMARQMPQGPQALAEALYFITSSGFKGAAAMRVLRASAKAAAAGLGDTATVADAVTSAVNAYGEKSLSASRATDILLATVREGKAEPTELAGAIGRVIAPAEAMGVSFAEVGGAVAGLSLTGLDAAEAVTALRGVLMTIMNPTKEAREELKSIGLTTDELQGLMADDLMGTLVMLREEFGDDKTAIGNLFGNVRALNGFLALTGRNVDKNVGVMHRLEEAVGDTDKAFDKAQKDPMFKFNRALSNLKTTLIEVAPTILPVAEKIVKWIEDAARAVGKWDKSDFMRAAKWAALAAAAGPFLRLLAVVLKLGSYGIGGVKGIAGLVRRLAGTAATAAAGSAVGGAIGSVGSAAAGGAIAQGATRGATALTGRFGGLAVKAGAGAAGGSAAAAAAKAAAATAGGVGAAIPAAVVAGMVGSGAYVRHMMMRDPKGMWAAADEEARQKRRESAEEGKGIREKYGLLTPEQLAPLLSKDASYYANYKAHVQGVLADLGKGHEDYSKVQREFWFSDEKNFRVVEDQVLGLKEAVRLFGGEISRHERTLEANAHETGNWATITGVLNDELDRLVGNLRGLDINKINRAQQAYEAGAKSNIDLTPGGGGGRHRRGNRGGDKPKPTNRNGTGGTPSRVTHVTVAEGAVNLTGPIDEDTIEDAANILASKLVGAFANVDEAEVD